jgi:hypothetical protein
MTMRLSPSLLMLAALVAGCSAAGSRAGASGGNGAARDAASASDRGGSGGSTVLIKMDAAGVYPANDGGGPSLPSQNLSTDAPVFDWDARAYVGADTAAGASGASGSGGKGGSAGMGGASGRGGSVGAGGSHADAGSTSMDARPPLDMGLAADMPPLLGDVGAGGDAITGAPDASADMRAADSLPDSLPSDVKARCTVQIHSLVPSTDDLARFPLVAGANTRIVLRAEIVSGGPASGAWTWQATRDGASFATEHGTADPAAVAIPIASAGSYTFTVIDSSGACSATAYASAAAADACGPCDRSVILRAAPPPTVDIPVQAGAVGLSGSSPFAQNNIVLAAGMRVMVSPSVGSNLVSSYVRISGTSGDLVADGLADPPAGFGVQLLDIDSNRAVLKYDVLVVPIDGSNGGTVAATAPQLWKGLAPAVINSTAFSLTGGVTVTGTTLSADGKPVADARVMLTNQDPAGPPLPSHLIFSSVGRADAQGSFVLHVQPGQQYWVSVAPAAGSGFAEALAASPIVPKGDTTLTFQWDVPNRATLTLNVKDARGEALTGAKVRLTSSQSSKVGTLTVGASESQEADGNVRVEGTTSAEGIVIFANLPADVAYDVLLVPATLGINTATTLRYVTVPAGGITEIVQCVQQSMIQGQLVPGKAGTATPDWTQVNLVAYDRSQDSPEAPRAIFANSDGTFSLWVSPGRPYVVQVVPDTQSGLARTFVGPGPLEASEFPITQRVQASMDWMATVMDETQRGLSGTALQVFCGASWPNCIDSTIPLAETTSEANGVFQLALPDPATR